MRLGVIAVVLAGCFKPSAALDAPCAPEGAGPRCPDGLVCVSRGGAEVCSSSEGPGPDGGTDASVDGPPGDQDGDGFLDAVDNCPAMANADQDDEDDDGLGDACDPCPVDADPTDSDADGLPDGCDPHPSTGGDQLLELIGFDKAPVPVAWTMSGVVVDNGDAIFTAAPGALLTRLRPVAAGKLTVWTDATLDSIAAAPALGAIGVTTQFQDDTNNLVCQQVGTMAGATQKLRLFENGGLGLIAEADHPLAAGSEYEVRVTEGASGGYTCAATNPAATVTGTSVFLATRIGVRLRSVTAHVHWVMVIESP